MGHEGQTGHRRHLTGLPDFMIIGAMKSGTTSLFNYLAVHPDLIPCEEKEPSFFAKRYDMGLDWYRSLYPEGEGLRFEGSTDYTKHPTFTGVPARIHQAVPEAKLIFVVRHPIERLLSHLQHNLAQGRLTMKRFSSPGFWEGNGRDYIYVSKYGMQIEEYLKWFPLDRFLFIRLEHMAEQPRDTLATVAEFLGIDDAPFDQADFKKYNEAQEIVAPSNRYVSAARKALARLGLVDRRSAGHGRKLPRPELSSERVDLLWEELSPDLERFEEITGFRLDYFPHAEP